MQLAMHDPVNIKENAPDIVYEVYVQSFCDSNQDGIGDLPGLISKLDYIKDLGATSIWLMPVHPSPSYHKYDVTDYYAIHPDYGTMADMEKFIAEATRRKMTIILDLVINHTSAEHPWFIASSSSPENPYRPYYVWKDIDSVKGEIEKKETTFDSDNLTQWHEWPGQEERYYGFFWKGMPDLNFDHPAVREEMYKVAKFWIDKGIDGFRLDAAKHIYPDDQLDQTKMFWEEFTARVRKMKPDIKIIGEVWADPPTLSGLFKGLPSLFNFELSKIIPESILHHDAVRFMNTYQYIRDSYTKAGVPFEDAILLGNHDINRIRSTLGGDLNKAKLAASILLTLPGTPYIYYGEEIGMLGVKPDIHLREPFLWGDEQMPDTSWQQPVYSKSPAVTPLKQQRIDFQSIYQHYKQWIEYRKAYPVMSNGTPVFQDLQNKEVLAYLYTKDKSTIWVVHNLGEKTVRLPLRDKGFDITKGEKMNAGDELVLTAYTSALVRIGQ
jgi:glycosidase